jgi:predicted RNase H-like HicB family nuclease
MKFIVTFTPDEDGGFVAECPGLPGCISHGDTIDEAERNIMEAIELSLETRRANGLPMYVEVREVEVAA